MGRPSVYTADIASQICDRLETGESLRSICRDEGMPDEKTVRTWASDKEHEFSPQYARSRLIGYEALADDVLEIADDARNDWMERNHGEDDPGWVANGEHIQRSRLRVDTRKWLLSKVLPKIYGDKVQVGGAEDLPPVQVVDPVDTARRVAFILAKATQ